MEAGERGRRGRSLGLRACGAVAALVIPAVGSADGLRTNWFHDPFFTVTHDVAACPEPLGPLVTEAEALRDSHHRSERGAHCYLEHRCRYASSYDYDREIADHIRAAAPRFVPHPSSLWVLVQGRRVWIYGCVPRGYRRGRLEKALRAIADVELAMEEVRIGAQGEVPYRLK